MTYFSRQLKPRLPIMDLLNCLRSTCRLAITLATVLPTLCCAASSAVTHVNVIVILVDDLGWVDLSCQGSTFYQTPNIDRLAAEGMRFTNGYAACAVCSPTRAAYMTGRYPARTGITDWIRPAAVKGQASWTEADRPPPFQTESRRKLLCPNNRRWLELEEITLAEELKQLGYVTQHIGKWHLGDKTWYPETQGFDGNIAGCDLGHPPSYFDPYTSGRRKRLRPKIDTIVPRKKGEYLTDREADEAVSFLKANADKPFFLSLCHYAVHTPIQAKQELTDKYESAPDPRGLQTDAAYAAMVHSVDEAAGRVLDALDELELAKDTLIIFTSDNGGLRWKTNNSPLRNGKGSPYEGGIRVPWIVRWPDKVKSGATCDEPIITCDIKPTVLDAIDATSIDPQPRDGVSLMKLLADPADVSLERSLFWHFPHYRESRWAPYAIIRKGPLKLIHWFEDARLELYDLAQDMAESENLVPSRTQVASELDAELLGWLESVDAKLPIPNAELVGKP